MKFDLLAGVKYVDVRVGTWGENEPLVVPESEGWKPFSVEFIGTGIDRYLRVWMQRSTGGDA